MREYDTTVCLSSGSKQLEDSQGIQRVRGGFRALSVIEAKSGETLDIEVIENSISFVRRVETQNFDAGRKDHEGLKREWFSRYDFELESIFLSLFWFSRFASLCNMMPCNISVLYVAHQKKNLTKYRWRMYSRCKVALIPVVSSNETILRNRG
jgi:hypothetical protein